jgi:hypothetical protein
LFPSFKDKKLNDDLHRSFMNQARTQDVSEVLDTSYVPATNQTKELVIEKQKYVYSVLESTVMTDKGRAIVQGYKDTFDAQKVYQKLTDHHLGSTKAMVESSTIPSYITTVQLGSGEWNGSAEGFIANWNNQCQVYEHQLPSSEHFPDDHKMSMLENTVSLIAGLCQVKNIADLEKTKTGKEELTNKEFLSELLSAAAAYDKQSSINKVKHNVVGHNIIYSNYDSTEDDDVYYLSAHVSVKLDHSTAHRTKSTNRCGKSYVQMHYAKWYSLDDIREIWYQLDNRANAIILGYDPSLISSNPGTMFGQFRQTEICMI